MADIFNYLRNHAARYRGSGIGATSANAATPISTLSDLDQHLTDWYQNAPIGFHTLDANGIYTEVNETELRWLGYRRDELVGKMHIASLLTKESQKTLWKSVARAKAGGDSEDLEYEAIRKDGSTFFVLTRDFPLRDGNRKIIGYHLCLIDITQRKKIDEALRVSEANFARAQALAHVGHYEMTIANATYPGSSYWSDEAYRIFGRDPAAGPLGFEDTIEQYIHPDDRAYARKSIAETTQGLSDQIRETRIVRSDGSIRHLRGGARFSPGPGTHPDKVFGVLVDITDLKVAQDRILQSEVRFRAMIEKSDETIALFTADGIFTYASPAVVHLLGYPPESLLGRSVWNHIHRDDRSRVAADLTAIISVPGGSIVSQFRARHRSGDWRWVESAESNRLQDPDIGAIIANVRDITGRKTMETALAESNSRLRELSAYLEEVREKERADIAQALHDEVGQHYAGLQMGIHWLEQRHRSDPESVERTTLMRGLMTRAFSTIRNIIQSLHPPMLDDLGLAGAMEALVEDFSQHSKLKIEFTAAACDGLPKAHQLALFRGLQEALTNVSRHAAATQVNIHLQRDHASVRLTIADNGNGMSPSARERKGSFGLFGMSERIKALGGNFDIRSEPGAGTTIRLSVPINAAQLLEEA